MEIRLDLNEDQSERLVYCTPDFPVRAFYDKVSGLYNYACSCHWHDDFELLVVCQGELNYFVNGQVLHLKQGQGVFANSRRLHYSLSPEHRECLYSCLVFHPSVLGQLPLPTARYAQRLGGDDQKDYLLLDPEKGETDAAIIRAVCRVAELVRERGPAFELMVQAECAGILGGLWHRMEAGTPPNRSDPSWAALRQMVGYIQTHYQGPVRLEDIAAAGAVCRSKCCQLFRQKMDSSPIGYLNAYRMNKAADLLRSTQIPITEVARSCGFDSPSYFTESFRKVFGVSPREMRKEN